MAMQRPAARKALWDKVGLLRKGSYMPEPEWAMKTALLSQSALLLDPVSLFRVDGQNYVSQTAQKEKHMLAAVDIRTTLLTWIAEHPAFADRTHEVRRSLADVYFDQAYHHQPNAHCCAAGKPLLSPLGTYPQWRNLRFAIRLMLPSLKRPKTD